MNKNDTYITLVAADGGDGAFRRFYEDTENYYNELAGGAENRRAFVPHNLSESVPYAVIAYCGSEAAGCGGLRGYSSEDAEIKRLWVVPAFRGCGIASEIMDALENRAREQGYRRAVLQTRSSMTAAVALYRKRGYKLIENYPPYDKLQGAICFAKEL